MASNEKQLGIQSLFFKKEQKEKHLQKFGHCGNDARNAIAFCFCTKSIKFLVREIICQLNLYPICSPNRSCSLCITYTRSVCSVLHCTPHSTSVFEGISYSLPVLPFRQQTSMYALFRKTISSVAERFWIYFHTFAKIIASFGLLFFWFFSHFFRFFFSKSETKIYDVLVVRMNVWLCVYDVHVCLCRFDVNFRYCCSLSWKKRTNAQNSYAK